MERISSDKQFTTRKHSLMRKSNVHLGRKRILPFIEKVPALVSDWSIFMQMRNPKLHSTVPTGWLLEFWLLWGHFGQYRCK